MLLWTDPSNADAYVLWNKLLRELIQKIETFKDSWSSFFAETSDSNLYVRLVDLDGRINRERGRVQVSRDNTNWGAICDDSWDERDAEWVKHTKVTMNDNQKRERLHQKNISGGLYVNTFVPFTIYKLGFKC